MMQPTTTGGTLPFRTTRVALACLLVASAFLALPLEQQVQAIPSDGNDFYAFGMSNSFASGSIRVAYGNLGLTPSTVTASPCSGGAPTTSWVGAGMSVVPNLAIPEAAGTTAPSPLHVVHFTATGDVGISQHNKLTTPPGTVLTEKRQPPFNTVYSNDVSQLLPVKSWGTSYHINGYGNMWGPSEFAIVTTVQTTVTITPSVATAAGGIPAKPAGVPFTIALPGCQGFQIQALGLGDFTGTTITATSPIGVFSGSNCGNVLTTNTWCDHTEEQVWPDSAYNKDYKICRSPLRAAEKDVVRVRSLAGAPITVTASGIAGSPFTVAAGGFVDFEAGADVDVSATGAVQVEQLLKGASVSGMVGDPAITQVQPTSSATTTYGFHAWTGLNNFAMIGRMSPTTSVTIDGVKVTQWSAAGCSRINVAPGFHIVKADGPVVVQYGGYNSMYASYLAPAFNKDEGCRMTGRAYVADIALADVGGTGKVGTTKIRSQDTGDISTYDTKLFRAPFLKQAASVGGAALQGSVLDSKVSTDSQICKSYAQSSAALLRAALPGGVTLEAKALDDQTTASCAGFTHSFTIAYLRVNGMTLVDTTGTPPPGTTYMVGTITVTIDEVTTTADTIEAVGIHVTVPGVADIKLFGAKSDIHECTPDPPSYSCYMTGRAFIADIETTLRTSTQIEDTGEVLTGTSEVYKTFLAEIDGPLMSGDAVGAVVTTNAKDCSSFARASVAHLRSGPASPVPWELRLAESTSETTSCTISKGRFEAEYLMIAGQSISVNQPAPNTVIPLGVLTVILNEQTYAPGWFEVNGVHIIGPGVDIRLISARTDQHPCTGTPPPPPPTGCPTDPTQCDPCEIIEGLPIVLAPSVNIRDCNVDPCEMLHGAVAVKGVKIGDDCDVCVHNVPVAGTGAAIAIASGDLCTDCVLETPPCIDCPDGSAPPCDPCDMAALGSTPACDCLEAPLLSAPGCRCEDILPSCDPCDLVDTTPVVDVRDIRSGVTTSSATLPGVATSMALDGQARNVYVGTAARIRVCDIDPPTCDELLGELCDPTCEEVLNPRLCHVDPCSILEDGTITRYYASSDLKPAASAKVPGVPVDIRYAPASSAIVITSCVPPPCKLAPAVCEPVDPCDVLAGTTTVVTMLDAMSLALLDTHTYAGRPAAVAFDGTTGREYLAIAPIRALDCLPTVCPKSLADCLGVCDGLETRFIAYEPSSRLIVADYKLPIAVTSMTMRESSLAIGRIDPCHPVVDLCPPIGGLPGTIELRNPLDGVVVKSTSVDGVPVGLAYDKLGQALLVNIRPVDLCGVLDPTLRNVSRLVKLDSEALASLTSATYPGALDLMTYDGVDSGARDQAVYAVNSVMDRVHWIGAADLASVAAYPTAGTPGALGVDGAGERLFVAYG